MDELSHSSYGYNNHYLQRRRKPCPMKYSFIFDFSRGYFQNKLKELNIRFVFEESNVQFLLTFWPKVFLISYLLSVSNPVNVSSSSTIWWTNNWSIDDKYSKPVGQFGITAGIFIQTPILEYRFKLNIICYIWNIVRAADDNGFSSNFVLNQLNKLFTRIWIGLKWCGDWHCHWHWMWLRNNWHCLKLVVRWTWIRSRRFFSMLSN